MTGEGGEGVGGDSSKLLRDVMNSQKGEIEKGRD